MASRKINHRFTIAGGYQFKTLSAAKRAAQEMANKSGRRVSVDEYWTPVSGSKMTGEQRRMYRFEATPRANPAAVSKSPNLLAGATILKSTRTAKGVIKSITVRLRDGLGLDGKPKPKRAPAAKAKRRNPAASTYTVYWKEKGETRLHQGSIGESLALQKARAKSSARGGNYAEVRNAAGTVVFKHGRK